MLAPTEEDHSARLHHPRARVTLCDQWRPPSFKGLEGDRKTNEKDARVPDAGPGGKRMYATHVEEGIGMVAIHNLLQDDSVDTYKVFNIMDKYFPDDEEIEAVMSMAMVHALSYVGDLCRCPALKGRSAPPPPLNV
ncbi:hypothetical protein OF83DRAFT_1178866 [Amylostereum chailletii]|nr:hypothetical protein OF83DRAFT_1178866 [Amylostereum chailletii]